jgi:ferredoxin-NADP reductase
MPPSNIYKSHIIEKIRRTKEILSLRFKKPSDFHYKAGQFMFITYESSQGKMRKHLTISSSPTESFLEITKRLTSSNFSNGLLEREVGDRLLLEGPYGDFTADSRIKKIGMLCGGIGVTPLRSMIRFYADRELDIDIRLIYSNTTKASIAFKDEFDALEKNDEFNFKIFHTLTQSETGWDGQTGRINEELVKKLIPDYLDRKFYTSGPPAMVDAMKELLKKINVKDENIKYEYFPGYSTHSEIDRMFIE